MICQTSTTPMYPDAYLEDCADEFVALGLAGAGITLLQYLADPDAYRGGGTAEPLLPEQLAVQQRLDAAEDEAEADLQRELPQAEHRGGALREALHHNTFHRRSPAANFTHRLTRRAGGAR